MSESFKFTKTAIKDLTPPPPGQRVYYRDTELKGLILQHTGAGTLTFYLYRWVQGKPERMPLGRWPTLTVEQARKEARIKLGQIANNHNPNDDVRAHREEMTFGELFDLYLSGHAKPHKRSWKTDEANYNRYLVQWKGSKLSTITRPEVAKLHTKIGKENGHYAANRVLALISSIFNKAPNWGWNGDNPAKGVVRFKEQSRDRFLQPNELKPFFEAVEAYPNPAIRDYILLSLLTGARRSNVLAMRWADLDLLSATWRIPLTKNGTPQVLPLVPEAVTILEERRNGSTSEWVFPSDREETKTGHLVEPKKAWAKILKEANLVDLQLHDLRRSLGSWQAMTGASLSVIGKSLNHKNVSTTAIYARLNMDPVRDAMGKAVETMLELGKGPKAPSANESTPSSPCP
jgi:integrase